MGPTSCLPLLIPFAAFVPPLLGADGGSPALVCCCRSDNDLHAAAAASGIALVRVDAPGDAIDRAPEGGAVLILVDGYPREAVRIDPEVLGAAEKKGLTLYIEYPAGLPGIDGGPPREAGWERIVVSAGGLGDALPEGRILMVHGCRLIPLAAPEPPLLVLARVAGFDRAVFGLPKERFPILFEVPGRRLVVAATRLSGFVAGRYAPTGAWRALWDLTSGSRIGIHLPAVQELMSVNEGGPWKR